MCIFTILNFTVVEGFSSRQFLWTWPPNACFLPTSGRICRNFNISLGRSGRDTLQYEVRSEGFQTARIKTRTLISGIKFIHDFRSSSPGSEHNDPSAAAKPGSIPGNLSLSACQAPLRVA
ncbi:hypothetical protein L798_13430 [Zootermopsis nevadensis]|uniref:Uncharacterized protein n=1 Tax=Zootermopsis nevadensis TaxID=136037 RepID=A0A067QP77_ZOONE|nr:hypothetical protein L798_13430 [Zootermopsis nevadensis]